jgi:hypothetical protein
MSTETGSVLAGTPAGGTTPPAGNTGGQPGGNTPPAAWYSKAEVDQGAVAWAKTRGYNLDGMNEHALPALLGHYNAEKLIGLDRAGRTVVLPKDDATPEEIAAFRGKLGVPPAANGYKLPEALREDPVAKAFVDVAHKAGYTQKQLEPVFEFVQQQSTALQAREEQERETKAQADVQALEQEWGQEFQLRTEAARRAVRELGLTPEEAQSVERTLGVKRAASMFFEIGKRLLEDRPEGMSGSSGGGAKFGLSPTEARGRIGALQKDTEFAGRLLKGDASAKAEWDNLHKIAYPG